MVARKRWNEVFRILQPLDVRDDLVRLHREAKMAGVSAKPLRQCRLFHQLPEGEVHFHRVQLRRVVAQKFRSAPASADKSPASSWDRPIPKCLRTIAP